MKKGRKIPKKQSGGYLHGPSHEEGGIIASTNGETVELEGGEYIINAQTVDALGTEFLDKINSTATTYHDGGFEQGQLPNPSQYRSGGQIRRNNMRRKRKFAHGGYHSGQNGFGMNPYQYGVYNNPYRRGGKVRRKFEHGGHTHLPNLMQTEHTTAGGTHHTHLINFQNQGQGNHNHSSHIQGRKMGHGGMMRNGNGCPPGMHMMPDGSCMEGAYHGANGSYRHGGYHAIPGTGGPGMPPPSIPNIMSRRGGMGRNVSQSYRRGGRPRRRFAHGGYHSNGMRNGCGPGEMCHGGMMMYEHGGGVHTGSPHSCTDGMGNNVPC